MAREVIVVDYDPTWPALFDQLKARAWPVVQDVALRVEHVGSTSVPGLAAKPIVDMDVVVPAGASAVEEAIARLARLGYVHQGNLEVEGREAFRAPPGDPQHNMYVCPDDSPALRNHLRFRDYLRSHPEDARAYAALKRGLAARFRFDIDGYVEGKTEFILGVLERLGFPEEEIARARAINVRP